VNFVGHIENIRRQLLSNPNDGIFTIWPD